MSGGGWGSTGARGGGCRICACIARGATLQGTGLGLGLALVAIVIVGSNTLRNGAVNHFAVGAVLSDVADLQAPVAVQNECSICQLNLSSSLCIYVGTQEGSVHVVIGYVSLGDKLAAERIVRRKAGDLGETEELSDQLQAGEVGRGDMLNPATDTVATSEIVDIQLVRPLVMAKEVHPCFMAQVGILLNVEGLNSLPKVPYAPALMLVDKLKMQLIQGAGNNTHGDLLGLLPASKLSHVSRRNRVRHYTSHACCVHEDADVVVGHEVCLEGSLPLHIVFLQ